MIRLALVLCLFSLLGFTHLPQWRARLSDPFHESCLKNAPSSLHKSVIQSLVCGSSLKNLSEQQNWKNLGLIHVLVVSGGHLSILAWLLMHMRKLPLFDRLIHPRAWTCAVGLILILFSLGNRLQPPILRALLEWMGRREFERRGWRPVEISLLSTWVALPFSSTIFDLLSLALSFFASLAVSQTAKTLHRKPILQAFTLQLAVWWILLPLLVTMGIPHPMTSFVNVLLAPLLGMTLIPLALLTWTSHLFPALSGKVSDPLFMGAVFDGAWRTTSSVIEWLSSLLPQASPTLQGVRALQLGFELTGILVAALTFTTGALLLRSRREARREEIRKSRLGPTLALTGAILLSILVHQEIIGRL